MTTTTSGTQSVAVASTVPSSSLVSRTAPDELFEALLSATSHKRKRDGLIALKRALDMMRDTRSREYTVAAAARSIRALGLPGPKEQSIRNAEGKDYRALIAAFASKFGKPPEVKRKGSDEDLVASVSDPRAAARVQWILAENRSLQRRLDILHAQYRQLTAVELTPQQVGPHLSASRAQFSEMEINAVRKFLASLPDIECSFDVDTGALLHDQHGFELAPPGFKQALDKVIGEGCS